MDPEASGSARGKCPICGRPSTPDYRPFCSRRCADVDLARWLGGAYAIPDQGKSDEPAGDGEDGEDGAGSDRSPPRSR